jgi:hypothetical protein
MGRNFEYEEQGRINSIKDTLRVWWDRVNDPLNLWPEPLTGKKRELATNNSVNLETIAREYCEPAYVNGVHITDDECERILDSQYGGKYEQTELRTSYIETLDSLLEESRKRGTTTISESDVARFRKLFFERFTADQIKQKIRQMWYETAKSVALREFVTNKTVDSQQWVYHSEQKNSPPTICNEDAPMSVEPATFSEKRIDIKKIGAEIDIRTDTIQQHIDSLLQAEWQLFIQKVREQSTYTDGDMSGEDRIYEARRAVRDEYYDPDTLVVQNDGLQREYAQLTVMEDSLLSDEAMQFVLGEHGKPAMRLERNPYTVQEKDGCNRNAYICSWHGNIALVRPDAIVFG